MKKLILTFVLMIMTGLTYSQQVTNTFVFTADLSPIIGSGAGFFDPTTDSIQVMGLDWDGLGTVISGNRKLTQGSGNLFSTSIEVQSGAGLGVNDSTKWKFKAFPDSKFMDGGFEAGDDRWVVFQANGSTVNLPTIVPNITPLPSHTPVTNTIVFTADLTAILGSGAGFFDPTTDSIEVRGLDWSGGTNVIGTRKMININPLVPGEFTTTLTVTSTMDSTSWKFKAYPDERFNNTGWESGSDRWYVYGADGDTVTLPVIVPSITPAAGPLTNPVQVTFIVNVTNAANAYNGLPIPIDQIGFVGIKGELAALGAWQGVWTLEDTTNGHMQVLTNIGSNRWSFTTTIPAGTPGGLKEFKFGAMYPGADTVNLGSNYLDNEAGFAQNHSFILFDAPGGTIVTEVNWRTQTTSVEQISDLIPGSFELAQNYPNPFNPSTTIRYSIPESGFVNLKVYNALGQEVAALINQEQMAGVYEVSFDASKLSSGIYFYSIQTGNFVSTKKMMLIK